MGEDIMPHKYEKRETLIQGINAMYKIGYKKEPNTIDTHNKLLKKLDSYDKRTKREFLKQAEKAGFTSAESLTFIRATERYNRERKKKYDEYIKTIVNPRWNKTVSDLTTAQKARIFGDKGGLTKEGKEMYKRFAENLISPVIPMQDKSIIIGDWQTQYESKEKILETRMRMGLSGYIDEKAKQYKENFKSALSKTSEDADYFLNLFNGLSDKEQDEFIRLGGDVISQRYALRGSSGYLSSFMEIYNKVKSDNKFELVDIAEDEDFDFDE